MVSEVEPPFGCHGGYAQPSAPNSKEYSTMAAFGSGATVTCSSAVLDTFPRLSVIVYGVCVLPENPGVGV